MRQVHSMAVPTCLVTGSSGLIGSEVCATFRPGAARCTASTTTSARSSSDRRATRAGTCSGCGGRSGISPPWDRHPRSPGRGGSGRRGPARTHRARGRQPSHDRAAAIPFDDFDTNAVGTLNLLEAARAHCRESPFVHMSTNKVYGDRPNTIALARAADALGLRRSRVRGGHARDVADRPVDALAVRRLEGRGRRDGAGVRPLLRHADLLPARRLPHRPEPLPASSCTASSATW